jgi:hypothetical protein
MEIIDVKITPQMLSQIAQALNLNIETAKKASKICKNEVYFRERSIQWQQ